MPSINIRVKTIEELANAVQSLMNLQKQFFDRDSNMIRHLSSIETTVQRATGLLQETIYNVGIHKDILQQAAIGNTHGIFFDLEFEISCFNPRWGNFNEVMIEPTKTTLGDVIHSLKAVCRKIIDMNFAMTRIETPISITNKTESMLKELLEEAVAGAMADLSCLAMNFEENGIVDTEVAQMLLHLDNAKSYLEDIEDIFAQAVVGLEKALNADNRQRSWDVRNDARRVLIDARIGCRNVRGLWKFVHKEMESGLCGDLKEMSRQFWDSRPYAERHEQDFRWFEANNQYQPGAVQNEAFQEWRDYWQRRLQFGKQAVHLLHRFPDKIWNTADETKLRQTFGGTSMMRNRLVEGRHTWGGARSSRKMFKLGHSIV
ncbi:hypothetical protein F5877DRAFT_64893 [Lentinula edodes]|nr:hypothetical protein F5877DRAFT_64893 [Lentinula edodes]